MFSCFFLYIQQMQCWWCEFTSMLTFHGLVINADITTCLLLCLQCTCTDSDVTSDALVCLVPLSSPCPLLDSIRVMVIVWRLRGNIIRTALCWIVWHSVHSQQHTYVSSSYRSNRLGLSHFEPYAVHRGSCLKLYYCNMVEWFWCDSSLISTTNWFPSVLWHC